VPRKLTWKFRNRDYQLGESPLLMGIVNVTPDSFSDGGEHIESSRAVEHALKLADQGADFLDIGGESTRPGSKSVDINEELQRVIPVIEQLAAQSDVPISIDTSKAAVARQAIAAGAEIVNDISGMTFDPEMIDVCQQSDVGLICMHIQGTPATMQEHPHYENVVAEILQFFRERLTAFEKQRIAKERIIFDPGVGFGKTANHNVEILSSIAEFRNLERPVLIGHSRKRFLGKVVGRQVEERTAGTLGVSIALAGQSTDIIRVHDVAANRDAILAWQTINAGIKPE